MAVSTGPGLVRRPSTDAFSAPLPWPDAGQGRLMRRSIATHLELLPLLAAQDYVVSRQQALEHGLSRGQIDDRLASRAWQVLLPGVYLVAPGTPTRRQKMIGALLWAGADAAIDGIDACRFHGIKAA